MTSPDPKAEVPDDVLRLHHHREDAREALLERAGRLSRIGGLGYEAHDFITDIMAYLDADRAARLAALPVAQPVGDLEWLREAGRNHLPSGECSGINAAFGLKLIAAADELEAFRAAALASTSAVAQPIAVKLSEPAEQLLRSVREVQAEIAADKGNGMWRPCTGCYETNEGHAVGEYPFSPSFGCVLGAGCHECGGIGAIWDTTDYDAMAREMLVEGSAFADPAVAVEPTQEPVALTNFEGSLHESIIARLVSLTGGSCSCGTKSPELKWHTENCRYRIAAEALEIARALYASPITVAGEPEAVKLLRGPLSKRATSAEFNEWQAREVIAYIDALAVLRSPPIAGQGETDK